MLRIESLEIDDHILDKSMAFPSPRWRKLVFQEGVMLDEAGKDFSRSSARRPPVVISWWSS